MLEGPCTPPHSRSRCTGYRPILDAFKAFAKVDAAAYTEEAIAASKAGNGSSSSKAGNGSSQAAAGGAANGSDEGAAPAGNGSSSSTAANGSSSTAAHGSGGGGEAGGGNGHACCGKQQRQRLCPSTGRPCDCAAAGELDAASGTVTSASKHKEEACGPLTHTRPAGGCNMPGTCCCCCNPCCNAASHTLLSTAAAAPSIKP